MSGCVGVGVSVGGHVLAHVQSDEESGGVGVWVHVLAHVES